MKLKLWQLSFLVGLSIILVVIFIEFLHIELDHGTIAAMQLGGGVLLIAGASEAFVHSVEGISQNHHMTDYVSGIYASLAATIPELSLLTFLLMGRQYELAWILALATIFMNSLVFAIYTLFLPKDEDGNYELPPAIIKVGSDLLQMGGVISLAVGLSLLVLKVFSLDPALNITAEITRGELLVFGAALVIVYIAYLRRITKYYGKRIPVNKNEAELEHVELEQGEHGRISDKQLGLLLLIACAGALFGGESLSAFATFVTTGTDPWPIIPTALLMVLFGGSPEYIIVSSSHIKDRLEVALSNAFGGIVQVFFVIFGFTLLATAFFGGTVPIDLYTIILLLFAFPTLYLLQVKITDDAKVNNLESIAMIMVFVMMLYMLLTFGSIGLG